MPDELDTSYADLASAYKAGTEYLEKLEKKKTPKRRGTIRKK